MPPNVKAPVTVICGNPIAAVTPLLMPKAAALEVLSADEDDVNAVVAQARFIDQARG